ncbi:MAG: cupin domain-containing protein [Pseudomonadota bacterium]
MTGEDIITHLGLERHPEGGWYRQTWIAGDGPRPSGTCIYFLLCAGERSHWHRVDATEIWHFYAGAPLILRQAAAADGVAERHMLGPDLLSHARPQVIVPEGYWQSAETTGDWTLVGCTVSPAFQFSGFDLAPPDFEIPER